nr:glycoside hydrolase family 55 protein [Escherichia coli]
MGYKTPDDFGAKGDGSTDDTTAILNAFSWASTNGLPLRVPSKTYVWNGDVIPYDNVTLIGDKRPYADSGLTRLLDGSIIVGTLRFSAKTYKSAILESIMVRSGSLRQLVMLSPYQPLKNQGSIAL